MSPRNNDDPVIQAIRLKADRMKLLTRLSLLFGVGAIFGSLLMVAGYTLMIRPKQTKTLAEYIQQSAMGDSPENARARGFDSERVQWIMIQANSFSIALVAVSVGVLGIGTLINIAILMGHRNAVSEEVRHSLASMSDSLKKLS